MSGVDDSNLAADGCGNDPSPLKRAARLLREGNAADAERLCGAVLARRPANAAAHHLGGLALEAMGRGEEGIEALRRSIALSPGVADFHLNLAAVLGRLGRHGEAEAAAREAVRLRPTLPTAHQNLGSALLAQHKPAEAAAAFAEVLRLTPDDPAAQHALADALRLAGRLTEAMGAYGRSTRLDPANAGALWGLATCCSELGRAGEAVRWHRRRVALLRDVAQAHSDLLFTLLHDADATPRQVFAEHLRWARRHGGARRAPPAQTDPHDRSTDRPLRVGYVSPDFRLHPVATFFEPVLGGHDRSAVEPFCYSNLPAAKTDRMTAHLRRMCGEAGWREIAGVSDADVATMIARDRIDVLVDLAGHTAGHRLTLFASRPAPVQVTYIGYPYSTGLRTIDFKITDDHLDPPDSEAGRLYAERLIRLPQGCWAYRGDHGAPDPGPLPAIARGAVTFACLNRPMKLTPAAVRLWGEILRRVPGSRLMTMVGAGCEKEPGLIELFAANGVPSDRLVLAGRQSRRGHLARMREIDVALDTFPHAGHTTTCDALWMGIPTVTLAGANHVARLSVGVLSAVRLGELVAPTAEAYVEAAVRLANGVEQLSALRAGLRHRMLASPLCDGRRLAAAMERAYRQMWDERGREGRKTGRV